MNESNIDQIFVRERRLSEMQNEKILINRILFFGGWILISLLISCPYGVTIIKYCIDAGLCIFMFGVLILTIYDLDNICN